ncbi:MAG: tyrosine-type recombinase/integrase [Pseudomonadota bacterium]
MASEILNFTRASISAITPPEKGRTYYRDEKARSLLIDVQASGKKTFQVYRKVSGHPTRITLGQFSPNLPESRDIANDADVLSMIGKTPTLNVKIARKLADAVNASLDKGVNPAHQERHNRMLASQELTLRQAFDRYYEDHLAPQGKRTASDLCNDFDRYLGKVAAGQKRPHGKEKVKSLGSVDWEDRKLSSISQADVRKLMIDLKNKVGPRTANKTFVLLRSIYNKIINWQLYTGNNPCEGIGKFKENSRERFITFEEIPIFMAAVKKVDDQDFRDFVLLSLYTGARRANVLAMRWQDLNFHAGTFTVPSETSKNGAALTIPLTSASRKLLEHRKASMTVVSPFVFPANSASGYMSPPNKRWKKFLTETGIIDLRLHDLRRSLGSWAAMDGASLPIIGKMLGHKSNEATAVYAHLQFDPVKVAMESATSAMEKAATPKKKLRPLPPSK